MSFSSRRIRGFTLIEMMVSLAVVIVLLLVSIPSFQTFRQRAALRAAADQSLVLWNQARFEAAKRNTFVKFGRVTSGANYCLGAATTTDPADTTACDCTTANACNVGQFPPVGAQSAAGAWRGVTISTTSVSPAALTVVVIEPKRTFLTSAVDRAVSFNGPPGPNAYQLYLRVDQFGRAVLCEPTGAVKKLSDYSTRRCSN